VATHSALFPQDHPRNRNKPSQHCMALGANHKIVVSSAPATLGAGARKIVMGRKRGRNSDGL